MAEVMLYDRDGNPNTYDTGNGVRLYSEDGIARDFISASPIETEVQLDFSEGNMEVLPGENELFSKVTITKPPTLVPENISKGVTIAGVKGELQAGSMESKPIRFYDHLGNVKYGYTRAEIQEMTELPPGFNLHGASFDQWTHTLDELKAVTYFADVGPMFTVNSYPAIVIVVETIKASQAVKICTYYIGSALTINWGDGSTSALSASSSGWKSITTSHTYSNIGRYIVTISRSSSGGRCLLGYQKSSFNYNIIGDSISSGSLNRYSAVPDYAIISVMIGRDNSGFGYGDGINYAHSHDRLKFISTNYNHGAINGYVNCVNLTTIAGKGKATCSQYMFYGNLNIKRIISQGGCNANSFNLCDSLKEVVFGSGSIVDANMNSKWSMLMTTETPPTVSATSPKWGTYPIYVPDSAVETYKAAAGWSNVAAYIFPASAYPDK